ncbi:hypothetical protein ACCS54_19560 [Rhizobium johnstonii]|uniref:hypothetical protein n=1 Tax=Rhizobium TaxID=379 RepID=UPI00140F6E44|nr:hypothetical protein [Rhizobium leguminosarum]QIO64087.1 hypothetical protein HA462_03060 [Rhizobium leguminosarum bv. trifolii]
MYVGSNIYITAEIARRLIQLINKRLALPVAPFPGEGLADLIMRASYLNRYLVAGKKALSHTSWSSRFDLDALSDRLGTPHGASDLVGIVYLPTPPRFSFPSLNGHGSKVSFFGSLLSPGMFIKGRRVAPGWFKEALYSKAMWHLRPLMFDAHSHERLVDRCPRVECGAPLDFHHIHGVYRCGACREDLRDHPQSIEQFHDTGAVRFLTDLVDPERKGLAAAALHPDLKNEDPGDVFTLGIAIAELFEKSGSRGTKLSPATPTPRALVAAAKAILAWPQGVADAIEQIEATQREKKPLNKDAVLLKRTKFLISPSLSNGLRDAYQIKKIDAGSYTGGAQTAKFPAGHNPLEVARNTKAIQKAAERTGLSPLAFYGCFLANTPGNVADIVGPTFRSWIDRVLEFDGAEPEDAAGGMPLPNFVKAAFRGPGDPWPQVIGAIVDGKLPVQRPKRHKSFIGLRVSETRPWLDYLSGLQGISHGGLVIRLADARLLLNASTIFVANLFSIGMTFRELEAFDAEYVKPQELADRLTLRSGFTSSQKVVKILSASAVRRFYNFENSVWYSRSGAEKLFDL